MQGDEFGGNPDEEVDNENLACYLVENAAGHGVDSRQFGEPNKHDYISMAKIKRFFAFQVATEFSIVWKPKISDNAPFFDLIMLVKLTKRDD